MFRTTYGKEWLLLHPYNTRPVGNWMPREYEGFRGKRTVSWLAADGARGSRAADVGRTAQIVMNGWGEDEGEHHRAEHAADDRAGERLQHFGSRPECQS